MRHAPDLRCREATVGGVEHVPHRQRVRDREHGVLRPREERVEGACEPLRGERPALGAPRTDDVRLVRPGPGAVVRQQAALEGAEADLVECGQDDPLDLAIPERERERLLRPEELRGDADPDGLVRERVPQRERLRDTGLGEPLAGWEGADAVVDVRARVRVPGEEQPLQNSTLR